MGNKYSFDEVTNIIADLRAENGCPWDKVQTHESLQTCLIEECYEVIEAIQNKDSENLKEELGDVLLQVLMHSQIAKEEQKFDITDVVSEVGAKMIRRHPHVFGMENAETKEEGLRHWEAIKAKEKEGRPQKEKGELSGVPKAFPALVRAQKVQKKAEKSKKFERDILTISEGIEESLKKIKRHEEISDDQIEKEMEKLLFEVSDLARKFELNAEISLTNATEKFINRLEGITEVK